MTANWSADRWANNLTLLLNSVYGAAPERFPVDVIALAKEYSHQTCPDDPITLVKGASLPNFDGALYRAPDGKKGWGIIYNQDIVSEGRINFTLAHEFGHYLVHRLAHPDGLECGQQDIVRWDSEYARIEQQANQFAAGLLMPLDDFRCQIDERAKPSLADIGACANRYRVSLISAVLRWLQYTTRRSVLVVSRDGYILWARSSNPALKTGAYFRTANRPPVAIPATSLPMLPNLHTGNEGIISHGADVWFAEPCEEIALVSDNYDFAISLLHLGRAQPLWELAAEDDDTFDVMARHLRR